MGVAEVVPGLSAGTAAMVMGRYSRIVARLSWLRPRAFRRLASPGVLKNATEAFREPDYLPEEPGALAAAGLFSICFLSLGVAIGLLGGLVAGPKILGFMPWVSRSFLLGFFVVASWRVFRVLTELRLSELLAGMAGVAFSLGVPLVAPSLSWASMGDVTLRVDSVSAERRVLADAYFATDTSSTSGTLFFRPAFPIVVPPGATRVEARAVSAAFGERGNLPEGSILHVLGVGGTLSVETSTAMTGGGEPGAPLLSAAAAAYGALLAVPGLSAWHFLDGIGVGQHLTDSVRHVRQDGMASLWTIALFALVAGVAVLMTARLVVVALRAAPNPTVAVLLGLMVGPLWRLWPFWDFAADGSARLALPYPSDPSTIAAGFIVLMGATAAQRIVLRSNGTFPSRPH